jgi:WD40 repeat protein
VRKTSFCINIVCLFIEAVRSISGHKAAICSMDFHRYGDILASGSMDTNLKVKVGLQKGLQRG